MESADLPPELTALVAAIESSSVDKAAALRYLAARWNLTPTDASTNHAEFQTNTSNLSHLEVHSCHICEQFAITRSPLTEQDHWYLDSTDACTSNTITLAKETITQGLAHACILIQWIYTLLAQDLRTFESDVAKRVFAPHLTSRGTTDHLEYISTQGVSAEFATDRVDEDGLTVLPLWVRYEPDPHLVDRLWNSRTDFRHGNSYANFEKQYRSRIRDHFRVSSAPDDPAASEVKARPTPRITDRQGRLDLAQKLFEQCQAKHGNCSHTSSILPSRVIDIGRKFPIKTVKLHWSEDEETGQYAAVSYCWGGIQKIKTTTETAQDHTDGIQFALLPATLQDAILVVHRLGLRYIWIDSLCIIQDDPEDLSREIANMAKVFQGASVTISAASAASVSDGFLDNSQMVTKKVLKLPYSSTAVSNGSVFVEQGRHTYNSTEDPINLRSWTLQEHILPRRMLVFGTKELWWTCESEVRFNEHDVSDDSDDIPTIHRKISTDRYDLGHWRSIVRDYSRRFLTYSNDKLSAIAGIADVYSKRLESRYLAGLWEYNITSELMWCSARSDISRPLALRAPSWSWASVDGEIQHNYCSQDSSPGVISIIECTVTPVSASSLFGPVIAERCILRVQGVLVPVSWGPTRKHIYTTTTRKRKRLEDSSADIREDTTTVGRTQADADDDKIPDTVWVLVTTKDPVRGLLLENLHEQTFRRLGLVLRLWDESIVDFEAPQTVISIV